MKNTIAVLLIIVSLGIFYFFIGPTYETVKTRLADKARYDDALNNSQKILSLRDGLLNKYNGFLPSDRDRLEKLLPDQVNNIRLLIEIDSHAKQYGLTLKNVTLNAQTPVSNSNSQEIILNTAPFKTVTLGFTVSGTYDMFLSFLRDMEQSLRILDVTSISFTQSLDKQSKASDFTLSLDTYSFIQQ